MLTCTAFRDRLYDEDCRLAMADGTSPSDMAAHAATCADCKWLWNEARADLEELPALLETPVPPALQRRLRVGLADASPRQAWPDWARRTACWTAVGAATAMTVARVLPGGLPEVAPLAMALTGASLAVVAGTLRDALRRSLA
jgi:hypothetical protein